MSKIDELISELCPEGVKSLSIAEIAEVGTGSSDKKDSAISGLFPLYVRSKNVEKSDTFEFDETAIIIPGEGGVGDIFHFATGKYALHQRAYRISPVDSRVDPKYLFYAFKVLFKDHISSKAVSATVTSIRKPMVTSFSVPIPPLEVQREIVSILDKFTQLEADLEAELEAELEARRSQFTYFVDRIFDLDGSHNAPSEPLKSACRITRASGLEKSQLQGEGLPVVQYGEIHMHYDTVATSSRSFADPLIAGKLQRANPGDVILVTTSEDVKDVGNPLVWLGPTPIGVGGESLIMEHDLDPVYLGMFFKSNSFYSQKLPYVNGSKVKRISTSNLQKIFIPVPALGVQRMLGESLLALENLVKSASVGLPAEIAARRKQYEYYRNQLLTFRELETA
jgi:type I restriction enzyme S subunit